MSAEIEDPIISTPLDWLHYKVVLASRTSYPFALMIGFTLYGNLILRRESGNKRYPNWIFGWPVGFIVYTYPASVFSDMVFQAVSPRIFSQDRVVFMYSFWFLLIQFCDPAYKFFLRKYVFIIITTWWLADATRVSLLTMERTLDYMPTFSRGMWQAFFWCTIVPVARCVELAMRGMPIPKLDAMVPNTLNAFRHPLISMFFMMVAWLLFLGYMTDCDIFGNNEGSLTAVECGHQHKEVYAAFVYLACVLHLVRSFYYLHIEGKVVFGEILCMGLHSRSGVSNRHLSNDLEQPLLNKQK